MIEQYVNAQSMSCLLSWNVENEFFPEPFRMQRSAIFRVTFSEYSNYVLSLQDGSPVVLSTDLPTIRKLLTSGNPLAYNYFLRDVAHAIIKELSFAERYHKLASIILPSAQLARVVPISRFSELYENNGGLSWGILSDANQRNIRVSNNVSDGNRILLQAACVLDKLASQQQVISEFHVTYDLY